MDPMVLMEQTVELDLQEQQDLQVQLEVVQLVHKVQRVRMEVMDHPVQRDSREHVERQEQSDQQKLRSSRFPPGHYKPRQNLVHQHPVVSAF
jgi:hypothetical protein